MEQQQTHSGVDVVAALTEEPECGCGGISRIRGTGEVVHSTLCPAGADQRRRLLNALSAPAPER